MTPLVFVFMLSVVPALDGQELMSVEALAGRALKWSMRGRGPCRREAARLRAVRCFRAGSHAAGDDAARALCALRAGELLRAGDLWEAALDEFTVGATFKACARRHDCAISAGSLLMAAGRGAEALPMLASVHGVGVPTRLVERAAVLRGEALATLGQHDNAIGLWRAVAERGVVPRARLGAFERWGHCLLERGDLEGAAGVLDMCRVALDAEAREATDEGRRLRVLLRHHLFERALRHQVVSRYERSEE